MELRYGVVSVDDHVQEHPDVWTSRMSKAKWGDRIPHLSEQRDGSQVWEINGQKAPMRGTASAGAMMPDRNQEPQRWDQVPAAAYQPAARLQAMDADGVDCSVLYPTVPGVAGQHFGAIEDAQLELACVQAYNDFLVEEWAGHSPRFVPQCVVPISSTQAAADELRRAVAKGHRGVILPSLPWHLKDVPHINDEAWDVVWAACQELEAPVCFHAGVSPSTQLETWSGFSPTLAAAMSSITAPASTIPIVANILFSRILTRFPRLKIVFAETTLAWGAYEIETADHQFERQRLHTEGYNMKPSELFHRQCYLTGWYDRAAFLVRHYLGVENMLWQTAFPQANSTWPNTRDYINRSFEGVPANEREMVLSGNAAKLYGL